MSVYDVQRLQGHAQGEPYLVQFALAGSRKNLLQNFQVAHFRNYVDGNFLPYGKSAIQGCRKAWQALCLLQDATLIAKIMRAPQRRIFNIDLGLIPPNEVDNHMANIMNQLKKVPFIDPNTGQYNLKYNMQNLTEDYFFAHRGQGSGTNIQTLPGLQYQTTETLDYFRSRVLGALRIPLSFLGYQQNNSSRANLASQVLMFAKSIQAIQKIVSKQLKKIAVIHLYSQGYRNQSIMNFDLELTNPSVIYQEQKISLWDSKINLAANVLDSHLLGSD